MGTIFYSWMSDHPSNTNRGFIKDALNKAANELFQEGVVHEAPRVDHDTQGVPGSPDIFDSICDKIDAADVYVADVTLMPRVGDVKPMPNPNVLLELGYALKAHDRALTRILLVMNTAHGQPHELPFNFGYKRVLTYELSADSTDKAGARQLLAAVLRSRLQEIHTSTTERARDEARSAWVGELVGVLQDLLPQLEQFDKHHGEGRYSNMSGYAERWARDLHRLAVSDIAEAPEMLAALARGCDNLSSELEVATMGQNYEETARELLAQALRIRDEIVDEIQLSADTKEEIRDAFRRAVVDLKVLIQRFNDDEYEYRITELYQDAGRIGDMLLQFAYLDLSPIGLDRGELQAVAHPLSLLQHERLVRDGGAGLQEAVVLIRNSADSLQEMAKQLK